ncbi:S8 family serine peptidase [Idiomarina sp. Sol25]|uniref:S8 family peptidase n=1 Tax=Idiomarina sp. Sol25 TaxID=3064000 RepID=UPI00294B50B7|nr:S8 family serine peptidase [Idiomarina sp. Sol25]MDV6327346.1 S8 family serine peptidase [Idiomarina sp. Sol25]
MKLKALATLAGISLTFSFSIQAQDIYQLSAMTTEESKTVLSDREVIIKFSNPNILDGLYTTPRLTKLKRLNEGFAAQQYSSKIPSPELKQQSLDTLAMIESDTGLKLKAVHTLRDYGLFQVSKTDLDDEELSDVLYNHPSIAEAQVNIRFKLQDEKAEPPFGIGRIQPQSINPNKSNDHYYQNQTIFYRQSHYLKGAASVERARDLLNKHFSLSGKELNIVVIDSGLTEHEDIEWADGYNFITDELDARDRQEVTNQDGDTEYHVTGHGLAVAGVFGATNNNSVGTKGILPVYSDGTGVDLNIVPAVAVNDHHGSTFDIYRAILWAVQANDVIGDPNLPENPHKADIINLSVGGFSQCGNYEYSNFLQEAVDIAANNNAVLVAAAGNEAYMANNNSPASCNNMITVGALDVYGEPTTFTNYGEGIDVMALGQTVYSPIKDDSVYKEGEHNSYGGVNGTSFAAPVVAGLAGMLKLIDRNLSPEEIESIIERTAIPLRTATRNNFLHSCTTIGCGYGAVNFERSITHFLDPIQNASFEAESYLTSMTSNVTESDAQLYSSLLEMDSCDAFVLRTIINNEESSISYRVYGGGDSLTAGNGELVASTSTNDVLLDRSAYTNYLAEVIDSSSGKKLVKPITFSDATLPLFCQ